jgi:hypothetical protein
VPERCDAAATTATTTTTAAATATSTARGVGVGRHGEASKNEAATAAGEIAEGSLHVGAPLL